MCIKVGKSFRKRNVCFENFFGFDICLLNFVFLKFILGEINMSILKTFSAIGLFTGSLFLIGQVQAQTVTAPIVYQNGGCYDLKGTSLLCPNAYVLTIQTFPPQPNRPIYASRVHTKFDGFPGTGGWVNQHIGYTDNNGKFSSFVFAPTDPNVCGRYTQQTFRVDSGPISQAPAFNVYQTDAALNTPCYRR